MFMNTRLDSLAQIKGLKWREEVKRVSSRLLSGLRKRLIASLDSGRGLILYVYSR